MSEIEHLFPGPAALAYGADANAAFLFGALPGASHLHLGCHGSVDHGDPLNTTLHLADGGLRLADLQAGLSLPVRLVVAAACDSALFDVFQPDEVVGLPAGFIQAGAAAVVAALWPVDDRATALLMTRFYELLAERRLADPRRCLRDAQLWLRDLSRAAERRYLRQRPALRRALRRGAFSWYLAVLTARRGAVPAVRLPWRRQRYRHPRYWAGFVLYGA